MSVAGNCTVQIRCDWGPSAFCLVLLTKFTAVSNGLIPYQSHIAKSCFFFLSIFQVCSSLLQVHFFSFPLSLWTKRTSTSGPASKAFSWLLKELFIFRPEHSSAVNCSARHDFWCVFTEFQTVERPSPEEKASPAFKWLNLPEHQRVWWYNLDVVCVLFRRWRQVFSVPLTLGLLGDSWLLLFKDQTSTWLSSSSHVL